MASPAQIEANRRNAQLSTGPRTEEGKARSSKNALSHGVFAEDLLLENLGETENELLALRDRLYTQFQPRTFEEEDLLEDLLSLRWRIQRARRAENGRLEMSSYLQVIASSKWGAAAASLLHPRENEPERLAQNRLLGTAVCAEAGELAKLALYEARLQKMYERTQDRLKKIQRERLAAEPKQQNEPISAGQAAETEHPPTPKSRNEPNFEAPPHQMSRAQAKASLDRILDEALEFDESLKK